MVQAQEPARGDRRPPSLIGRQVVLRPIEAEDREVLRRILAEPDVARWWAPRGAEVAVDGLYEAEGDLVCVIVVGGVTAGAISFYEENEPDYRHAAIDVFLSTDFQGRGFGPDAVATLARHLFDERGHHRLTIDPAVSNERAIRAYRKVGFRPVGVMRAYERGPDGSWHDGLLLDLLPDELVEPSQGADAIPPPRPANQP
jgi:aminoglycoside 6'-N-acetyltransferase